MQMDFNNILAVDINLLQIIISMYHLVHELFVSDATHILFLSGNDKLYLRNDVSVYATYVVL